MVIAIWVERVLLKDIPDDQIRCWWWSGYAHRQKAHLSSVPDINWRVGYPQV
jgi:hypothetical protein